MYSFLVEEVIPIFMLMLMVIPVVVLAIIVAKKTELQENENHWLNKFGMRLQVVQHKIIEERNPITDSLWMLLAWLVGIAIILIVPITNRFVASLILMTLVGIWRMNYKHPAAYSFLISTLAFIIGASFWVTIYGFPAEPPVLKLNQVAIAVGQTTVAPIIDNGYELYITERGGPGYNQTEEGNIGTGEHFQKVAPNTLIDVEERATIPLLVVKDSNIVGRIKIHPKKATKKIPLRENIITSFETVGNRTLRLAPSVTYEIDGHNIKAMDKNFMEEKVPTEHIFSVNKSRFPSLLKVKSSVIGTMDFRKDYNSYFIRINNASTPAVFQNYYVQVDFDEENQLKHIRVNSADVRWNPF